MSVHYKNIQKIARNKSNVLIIGEYGTGKGRTARSIHYMSSRAQQQFEKILCITGDAIEIREKLFGRLSYDTGNLVTKRGVLEKAHGSTLFLEHFASMPFEIVSQLTESYKKGYFRHVRTHHKLSFDVRLIASISIKDLEIIKNSPDWQKIIREIRPDILYQPPLRERREDIPLLMHKFVQELKSQHPFLKVNGISPLALYQCLAYDWPGNVRQLKNATIQAAFLCDREWIDTSCLPSYLNSLKPTPHIKQTIAKSKSFAVAEKELIHRVLEQSKTMLQASETLGYSLENLKHKLKQYRLKSPSLSER